MAQRAKIFRNGGSQAVRLPMTCRFPEGQSEVVVRRVGRQIINDAGGYSVRHPLFDEVGLNEVQPAASVPTAVTAA